MERMEWKPVRDKTYRRESPDGSDDWILRVSHDGNDLEQWSTSDDERAEIGSLSAWGFRLCRLTETDVPSVPVEAIRVLLEAGEFTHSVGILATTDGQYGDGETLSTVATAMEEVRAWLEQAKGGDDGADDR